MAKAGKIPRHLSTSTEGLMTKEQIRLVGYALDFLKSNLDYDTLDSLGLGNFEEVEQKIGDAKKCFELLAASKLNNP
jgi:hypothetical protein